MTGFAALGLNDHLLAVLAAEGHAEPTPIQAQAIPAVLAGRDLLGLAQTGTGKTAAFGLALVHRLMRIGRAPAPGTVRALVLVPTRELAAQVGRALAGFARGSHVKVLWVAGGASMGRQAERLAPGIDILVATPGRLVDLLKRQAVSLDSMRNLVLDEADHMLDLGFGPVLERIGRQLPAKKQVLMFSATMPPAIEALAQGWLSDPVRVEVAPPGQPAEKVAQSVHFVSGRAKASLLRDYLSGHPGERALVFAGTREGASKLAALLAHWGFAAEAIHGDRSQTERGTMLAGFRSGEIAVLVATDLAARGLDIPGVGHVYNYDLPKTPEAYVHRIGRTARAGAAGRAVSLCAPAEMVELRAIEAALGHPLAVAGGAPHAAPAAKPGQASGPRRARRPGKAKPGGKSGRKSGH
jgi:ATP-dependent RNA helicase RhlE